MEKWKFDECSSQIIPLFTYALDDWESEEDVKHSVIQALVLSFVFICFDIILLLIYLDGWNSLHNLVRPIYCQCPWQCLVLQRVATCPLFILWWRWLSLIWYNSNSSQWVLSVILTNCSAAIVATYFVCSFYYRMFQVAMPRPWSLAAPVFTSISSLS